MKSLRFRTEEPRSEWSCSSWCPGQMAQLWLVCRKNNWTPCLLLLSYGGFPQMFPSTTVICWEAEDVALGRPKKLENVAHIWSQSIECWSYIKLIQYCMCMRIYIYISYMAFQKYPKLNMTKQKGSNSSLIWGNPHQLNTVIVLADLSSPGKNLWCA